MTVRRRWSSSGKVCLLAAATFLTTALLFGHPFPAMAGGFALGLLLFTSPGGRALERLRFVALPPARLIEDEERLLEIDYCFVGALAPLAVVLQARGPVAALIAGTPSLLPTSLGRLPIRLRAIKRGRHDHLTFEVQVRGAFGFRTRIATFDVPTDLWVLPRPRALRERVLEEMLALRPRGLDRPQPTGPGDGEFYALRHWRLGDPERRVHMRLSARRGHKVLRIFRGEAPPLVHLVVDLRVGRTARTFRQGDFDEAMRFAAGIVRALLKRDVPISLALIEAGGARIHCTTSCKDLDTFLGVLALARPVPVSDPPDLPPQPAELGEGRRVVLHLGQVDETQLTRDWLAIRVGSRRYYQLLEMQLGGTERVDRAERTDAADEAAVATTVASHEA